jgi:hypothetical protein
MGRTRAWVALAAALLSLVACSGGDGGAAPSSPTKPPATAGATTSGTATASSAPPYAARHFVPHLTVAPPPWLPAQPVLDERHFLTWVGEGADVDRAVRFMSPVGINDPGHHPRRLSPVPRDYVAYFLGLRAHGAEITDRTTLDVDGHHATLVTARTSTALSGSLGCPERDLDPDHCYGLQTYALVRLAMIDLDGSWLLAWARTLPGSPTSDQDFAGFEDLLARLRFD